MRQTTKGRDPFAAPCHGEAPEGDLIRKSQTPGDRGTESHGSLKGRPGCRCDHKSWFSCQTLGAGCGEKPTDILQEI